MGKNVRVDSTGMSYVDKITEIECLTSDEIVIQYEKGKIKNIFIIKRI